MTGMPPTANLAAGLLCGFGSLEPPGGQSPDTLRFKARNINWGLAPARCPNGCGGTVATRLLRISKNLTQQARGGCTGPDYKTSCIYDLYWSGFAAVDEKIIPIFSIHSPQRLSNSPWQEATNSEVSYSPPLWRKRPRNRSQQSPQDCASN